MQRVVCGVCVYGCGGWGGVWVLARVKVRVCSEWCAGYRVQGVCGVYSSAVEGC